MTPPKIGGIDEADITNYIGSATGYRSILNTKDVTMGIITNGAGTSNTLLLAHKIMRPTNYGGGSGTDQAGWVSTSSYDHMRWCDTYAGGSNANRGYFKDDNSVDENHLGGPHTAGSPVLWADGGARMYNYGYKDSSGYSDDALFQALWAFNRGIVVNTPLTGAGKLPSTGPRARTGALFLWLGSFLPPSRPPIMRFRRHLGFLLLPALVLSPGCKKSGPKTVPVSGRVTMDKAPLANATIIFQPTTPEGEGKPALRATGKTDADGHYSLALIEDHRDGAIVGGHKVTIALFDRGSDGKPGAGQRVPEEYNRKSTLTFTVPPEGTKEANFDLSSKPGR